MKKNILRKEFFMEIRGSLGRFISIFFIVAMGVAFYSGIRASEPSMRISGDAYFDRGNLMDVKVMSTLGLTDEDLDALRKVKGIEYVEGAHSKDVLFPVGDTNKVVHVLEIQEEFNTPFLEEGRYPEKAEECLVDVDFLGATGYKIGDQVTIKSGNASEELSDTFAGDTFTIVGSASSPMYISFGRGSSLIGTGEVGGFILVTPDAFDMDVYSEAYIRVEGLKDTIAFTPEYQELSDAALEAIGEIEEERCKARLEKIKAEAYEEIADAEAEVNDEAGKLSDAEEDLKEAKSTASKELAKALKELKDGRAELNAARKKIKDGEKQIRDAKNQLRDQQKKIDQGYKEYNDNLAVLKQKEKELKDGKEAYQAAYEENMPEIEAGLVQVDENLEKLEPVMQMVHQIQESDISDVEKQIALSFIVKMSGMGSVEELEGAYVQLVSAKEELLAGKQQLEEQGKLLEEGEAQIKDGFAQIKAGKKTLDDGQKALDAAWATISSKEKELISGKAELASGEAKLIDGQNEYDKAAKKATEEIADGEEQIRDAKKKLEDARREIADAKAEVEKIESPKWYIQDRDEALTEYSSYGQNADQMGTLGKYFPLFFFLVAALISLTTMTRMVEEQRVQIGTMKALGYNKLQVAGKYMNYALLATVFGSIAGFLVGEKLFPWIIIYAYKIMFKHLPDILLPYNYGYGVIAAGMAVFCILAATLSACYRELAEQPASLMRPPAPKIGRKILLERIPFLWSKIQFTWKSSIRNLLRYKKRFFMTIFGIGGCMGLMLVGFGLKDCIYEVVLFQYERIQFYDASVYLEDDLSDEKLNEIEACFEAEMGDTLNEYVRTRMQKINIAANGKSNEVFFVVPEDDEHLESVVSFHSRTSDEVYHLAEDEIILTEKVAEKLGLHVGDTVLAKNDDLGHREVTVGAICENYMMSYLYMSNKVYEELYDCKPYYNCMLYQVKDGKEDEIQKFGEEVLTKDGVLNVSYTSTVSGKLDDMLSSLNLVIILLIISAGLLAFVVLYNLNNVNITERRRELATLKVLGFYDLEVASYVYRENVILTILGAVAGCGLGWMLHRFVILTVEVDNIMFGRTIHLISYGYAFLFTLLFSIIVNLVMFYKLRKIDMVESLKSIE